MNRDLLIHSPVQRRVDAGKPDSRVNHLDYRFYSTVSYQHPSKPIDYSPEGVNSRGKSAKTPDTLAIKKVLKYACLSAASKLKNKAYQ